MLQLRKQKCASLRRKEPGSIFSFGRSTHSFPSFPFRVTVAVSERETDSKPHHTCGKALPRRIRLQLRLGRAHRWEWVPLLHRAPFRCSGKRALIHSQNVFSARSVQLPWLPRMHDPVPDMEHRCKCCRLLLAAARCWRPNPHKKPLWSVMGVVTGIP